MRPIVYITAAILAIVAGYLAVYVNFLPHGKDDEPGRKQIISKKSEPVVKKEEEKPSNTEQPVQKSDRIITTGSLSGLNKGHMATFVVRQKPLDIPEFKFQDPTGTEKSLADWSGKVVLLNLWATWCAPCRKEMPALDKLKAKLGGDRFDVVTISIDHGTNEKPLKFFKEINIKNLVMYHDKTARLGGKLRAFGMPTTLLINRNGKELGRLVGPAEWDSEDAVNLIKAAIGS